MPVEVRIDSRRVVAPVGRSLFECAEEAGVSVPTSCHKNGKCRECLVEVTGGMESLSPLAPEERHLTGAFRLSCRARIATGEGEVSCHTLRRGAMQIEASGRDLRERAGPFDPAVRKDGDWVLLDGKPLVRAGGPILGAAVDVGTTTVVVRVVDLEDGRLVAARSFENPQRFGGSDVMSRIRYDCEHPGRLLQRTLLGYLGHALEDIGRDSTAIYEVVVAGNATMRDLLFGLDVRTIGERPYRSVTEQELDAGLRETTGLSVPARKLRLPVFPQARVYGLPLVRGHVGADAAAALLAIDLAHEDRVVALMDIGTNTELIAGSRGRVLAASCPAGPAFEGGRLACGMPGLEGAIESVRIRDDGSTVTRVIGGGSAQGICGSGFIEALSELRRTGRLDEFGRFTDGSERFVIDPATGVYISEADISELAQAKGANAAGLTIVLGRYGIGLADIERFYLAGGFGRRLDVESACRIGLIPDIAPEKVAQVGNASIEGAMLALCSATRRRELEDFVRTVEHVELETDASFFDRFVDGCQLLPIRAPATG